jgi:hypothetical protein
VNMIETLIIVRGKQIKDVYWGFPVHFWCQNRGVACHRGECHFNKLSMVITMAN